MDRILHLSDAYLAGMGAWLVLLALGLVGLLKIRRRWKRRGRKLEIVHALLSVWFLLAGLTIPELGCALFYDETDSFSLTNASQRWYAIHVQTNAAGFRDARPFPPKLPESAEYIGFAGDSFTFGHGVEAEDRFSNRIAARLRATHPGQFVVSNLGLPGVDLRQLRDRLLPEWIAEGADFDVLVYICVLNDIEYFDERTGQHYQTVARLKPRFFLFRETYFYNLLYIRLRLLQRPEVRNYYGYLQASYEGESWRRFRRKLLELDGLCRRNGIELRIVIFPFLHNLGPDYPFREAHRKLRDLCREQEIRCLDLEPILSDHADEGLTVNPFDAHPNERAHEVAARAIREHLLDRMIDRRGRRGTQRHGIR